MTAGSSATTVLIANRGEIAVRIVRAARAAGFRTVAVYTADEADALHVSQADRAVQLSGSGPAAYLDIADILRIAAETSSGLIHPGYGFLSESANFARACRVAEIVFIGPSIRALEILGDKSASRTLAGELGIPVLPATDGDTPLEVARQFMFSRHGAAAIVKAIGGGGGRGMRVVRDLDSLPAAMDRARAEAESSFGDRGVYLEAYLPRSRHVEVQVVGDGTGAVVHLWTRDCSLQRRHQKIIELAPAPGLSESLQRSLLDAACWLARELRFRGLVTVEFLLDVDDVGAFYFIEANPRLQVEHGVTELVTGVDLVAVQLAIATGATLGDLGLDQQSIGAPVGVAAEARINLEAIDSSGVTVAGLRIPSGPTIRVDTAAFNGLHVGAGFDPLFAKIMLHRTDGDARAVLADLGEAVAEFALEAVRTNRESVMRLLSTERVRELDLTTTLVDELDVAAVPTPTTTPTADGSTVEVVSEMSGIVVEVLIASGEVVQARQPLLVVEAMKMQHEVAAAIAGTILRVDAAVGDQVLAGRPLVQLAPDREGLQNQSAILTPGMATERDDVAENRRRHDLGLDAARAIAVGRRHATGKRTARENVADLIDPSSFTEYGALVIAAQRRRRSVEDLEANTPADGLVAGFGALAAEPGESPGSTIAVLAYDYTVLAGTQGLQSHKKSERLFELARRRGSPVVIFAEGGGGRPGDTDNSAKATGMDLGTFVALGRLSGRVPTVAIASGRCFAGNAAMVGMCDLVIATTDANIGMGGPAMIEGGGLGRVEAGEIGPAAMHAESGVVDILVADEAEAVHAAKAYLRFFDPPGGAWTASDQRRLAQLVPENRARVFDIREVIRVLADDGAVLELRAGFGRGMVTALARIEGVSVGIVANNGMHLGGAIDSDGADKMARFLSLCDNYRIPIVSLCDTPGFMVGPASEETAAVRHVARIFAAGPNLSVPLCTVIIRKSYGLGGQAMAGGGFRVPDGIVAWPTGELGAMGPEGAVRLGFRKELEAIEDPAAREAEFRRLVAEYELDGRAYNAASVFELDDVIDPAETRAWILATVRRTRRRKRRARRLDTW